MGIATEVATIGIDAAVSVEIMVGAKVILIYLPIPMTMVDVIPPTAAAAVTPDAAVVIYAGVAG